MYPRRLAILALAFACALPAQDSAAALLAKATAAYRRNLDNEKHWNWDIVETRRLLGRSGDVLQTFPSVTSESVIATNGRRCNAVTAWGDGRQPFLKDASPDARCQAYSAIAMPFDISLLLASTHATLAPSSGGTVAITIAPVSAPHPAPYAVRCAASIQATVHLDPATFHPTLIEGRVAGSGCNATFQPSLHFESLTREPLITQFRAGATFRIVYGLQKDKFDNPANSFWLITEQHYDYPWRNSSAVLYYWGRELPVNVARASRLVRNARITAREFGAGSLIRFDRDPPQ